MKKKVDNPDLRTWKALNEKIRTATEETCQKLLEDELSGRKRKMFILRIHSRINKIRANRERRELTGSL